MHLKLNSFQFFDIYSNPWTGGAWPSLFFLFAIFSRLWNFWAFFGVRMKPKKFGGLQVYIQSTSIFSHFCNKKLNWESFVVLWDFSFIFMPSDKSLICLEKIIGQKLPNSKVASFVKVVAQANKVYDWLEKA